MSLLEENKSIRCAIYARVSTEMQAKDGFSIDGQIETIKNHCEARGYEIVEVYTDKGLSGGSMKKRQSLQRLLEDAEQDKFDKLFVWKLSRLARNVKDVMTIVEKLLQNSVEFHSISENFDINSSTGIFLLQILGSVGEFERNIITDNVKLGQLSRAQSGYVNGNRVLGYDKGETPRDPIQINAYEAEVVKMIYNKYEEGLGYKAIATLMNDAGYKTIKGNYFSIGAIRYILQNPIYAGKVQFNKYVDWNTKRRKGLNKDGPLIVEGKHEAIIEDSQWQRVQSMMNKRSVNPKVLGDGNNLLTGILRCPDCAGSMVVSTSTGTLKDGTKKRRHYYTCQRNKTQGAKACRSNGISKADIEKYIQEQILSLINQPQLLQRVIEQANERYYNKVQSLQKQSPQLLQDVADIQTQIDRLQAVSESDDEIKQMLVQKIKQLRNDLEIKKKQIKEVNTHNNIPAPEYVYDITETEKVLKQIKTVFDQPDKMIIKRMYLSLIDRITFKKTRKNEILKHVTIYLKKDIGTQLIGESQESEAHSRASLFSLLGGIQIRNTYVKMR